MSRLDSKSTLLLALPYAGAGNYCYNFLAPLLPKDIYLETLEYPGRGDKGHLSLVYNMQLLLADLIDQYRSAVKVFKPARVILYGHSMGAVVGLALLHALMDEKNIIYPEKAILSGHGAPRVTPDKLLAHLSDEALIDYFMSIGSLSKEVAAEKDLMNYMLPILRNDLRLYEFNNSFYKEKLTIPLVIINGKSDDILEEHIKSWAAETTEFTDFHYMDGHHFFISQYPLLFASLITTICK